MKKLFYAVLAVFVLLLNSCDKDNSFHSFGIIYPSVYQPAVLYADQTIDSLVFTTTDNFQVSVPEATWITVPDSMKSGNIPNSYRMLIYVPVYLTFETNPSGKVRTGNVIVRSFDNDEWDERATATYYQYSWLNIISPEPTYGALKDGIPEEVSFKTTVNAEQQTAMIEFQAYGDWKLSDGDFLHVEKGLQEGRAGRFELPIQIDANVTSTSRTGVIVLTSNGISTPIEYTQEAPKSE